MSHSAAWASVHVRSELTKPQALRPGRLEAQGDLLVPKRLQLFVYTSCIPVYSLSTQSDDAAQVITGIAWHCIAIAGGSPQGHCQLGHRQRPHSTIRGLIRLQAFFWSGRHGRQCHIRAQAHATHCRAVLTCGCSPPQPLDHPCHATPAEAAACPPAGGVPAAAVPRARLQWWPPPPPSPAPWHAEQRAVAASARALQAPAPCSNATPRSS